jgi:hypothetical protein
VGQRYKIIDITQVINDIFFEIQKNKVACIFEILMFTEGKAVSGDSLSV